MDKKIIIFGKEDCGLCQGWKKKLENFNIPFSYFDINDPDNLTEFTLKGLTKIPAIIIGEKIFEGLKPSEISIEEIKKMIET
ncbi:MAG TPA: glutaredoxin domain-containing protein [bacterium]|nr:glutaredoxin domain-containing protein [bacterium]